MRGILAIPPASALRGWRALLAVLLCAATAGGCALVADIAGLTSRIQDAGYENVQVNHKVTNGVDVLTVEAVTPNEPVTDEDALRIAEIVWTTYPRQVDRLDLVLNGRQVVSASRQDLTEEFGQRNPDLDKGTGIGRILLVGLAVVGVMLVLLVLLIVLLIRRGRRRARQMPNPPFPPHQPYPPYQQNQPYPHGQPHQYGPPPPSASAQRESPGEAADGPSQAQDPSQPQGSEPGLGPVARPSRTSW